MSLITPLVAPFNKMVAPGNVCPSASITRPVIVLTFDACGAGCAAVPSFAAHTAGEAAVSNIPANKHRTRIFRLFLIKQKN